MNLARYPFEKYTEKYYYDFFSMGPQGTVRKLVCFELADTTTFQTFNLAFGDARENSDEIDDLVVTNNNDSLKVLLTVAIIALEFLRFRPRAWIHVQGNTAVRNRLYRVWIGKFWNEIDQYFTVMGQRNGYWQPFEKEIMFDRFMFICKK
jgi:hypothetical protein